MIATALRGLLVLVAFARVPRGASAAVGVAGCTSFVASLPATLSTPGTWCLDTDLATNQAAGAAITLAADDITLDCNGHRVDGFGGGVDTLAVGILATDRKNLTVRRCEVRTFRAGLVIQQSTGTSARHLVEDNLFNINRQTGVAVTGDNSVIRRNRVFKTGLGVAALPEAFGIEATGSIDILDNLVSVVEADSDFGNVWGITVRENATGSIRRNRVRGLHDNNTGSAYAIGVYSTAPDSRVTVRDNILAGNGLDGDHGIDCRSQSGFVQPDVHAKNNNIQGFGLSLTGCVDDGNVKRQ